jgi:hypothetical protein
MRLERVLRNYELVEEASYLQPQTQPPKKGLCKETSCELSLTNDLVVSRSIQIVRASKQEDVGRATHLRGVLLDAAMRGQFSVL